MAFDLAARIAFEAATELPHIDALIHASGPPPGDHARLARIRAFIQLHWSTKSAVLNQEDHDDLVKRIEPGRARLIGYKYDCSDGFYARPSGEVEASNARIAWDRTRDFLFQTLT